MPPTVRQNYRIAFYLYLATMLLFLLPALYRLLEPLAGEHNSNAYGLTGIILGTCLLLLGFFTGLGLGLRTGKTWAKVVYILYTGWLLYYCFRDPVGFLHSEWQVIGRSLLSFALQLSIGFFLFRHHFSLPATSEGYSTTDRKLQ